VVDCLWTPAELRRFLLAAPVAWLPVWLVAVFAGLRPGELQAMSCSARTWYQNAVSAEMVGTAGSQIVPQKCLCCSDEGVVKAFKLR